MRKATLKELAKLVDGELLGEGDIEISYLCPISMGVEDAITFCAAKNYAEQIEKTAAKAVVVNREFRDYVKRKPAIIVENADYAFALIAEYIAADYPPREPAIHKTAVIAENAEIGENVFLGPNVVVDEYAKIGANTIIEANSYIGYKVRLGTNCHIYQNVVIREHSQIGDRVIIQPGAVIGGDGFGFAFLDNQYKKIPQLGIVIIEDDVEIGANTCIDRARFDKTIIRKGSKLDNLIQIAHNVEIGEHTAIAAQAGFAGTSGCGDYCQIGGQVGMVPHIKVGNRVIIQPQAAVSKNFGDDIILAGTPAVEINKFRRIVGGQRLMPDALKKLRELETRLAVLEKNKRNS